MNKKGVLQSLFGLSLLLSLVFTGCDNFLNSSDVADEIKEEIKYTNSPVFSVRIAPESPDHGVVVSGNTKEGLRVSDEFELEFNKNADYIFLGWDAVKKDDHSVSLNDYVKFKDPNATTTTVKIVKGNSDIYNGQLQLRPYCRAIETGIINITSEYGAVSYNNEAEYKEGTILKLSINPSPGYGFTHWIVMVGDKQDTTGQYVSIDNPVNTVTDATFVRRPDNKDEIIYIIPVCNERPAIISTSPNYSDDGVCRDSRIKVIFDTPMDEGSIYFTTPEIKALGPDIQTIASSSDDNKIYGYWRDGKKYYKNIDIRDLSTGASLLEYFGEPKFNRPEMLVIPTLGDKSIPVYTELLVTISSNFSAKTNDNYSITLDGKTIWNYLVNNKKDESAPTWTLDRGAGVENKQPDVKALDGVFTKRDGTTSYSPFNWDGNWTEITKTNTAIYSSSFNTASYKHKYFVRDNKIKVKADFLDAGTGPAALYLYIDKINASDYTNVNEKKLPIKVNGNSARLFQTVEKLKDDGTIETVEEGIEIELKDKNGNDLPDGAYRLQFVAEDEAGKTAESDFYYVYLDTINPVINNNPTVTNSYTDKVVFTQTNGSTSNYLFYQMKKAGETVYSTPERITDNQKTVSSLDSGTTYDFKFFMCDEFGNDTNCKEFRKNTLPAQPLNVTITRDPANTKKVTIGWKKGSDPNFKGTEINVSCYKPQYGTVSSGYLVGQPQTITIPAGEQEEYTKEITNLLPGYRYQFNVAYYDGGDSYQNKYISPYTDLESIVIQPDPPKKLTVTNSNYNVGYVSLNWEAPDASGFVNQYEYSFKNAADDSAEWKKFKTDNISKEIDLSSATNGNLTGKTVKFKVESLVQKYISPYTEFARSTSAAEFQLLVRPLNLKNFAVDSNTKSSIKVKWDSPATDYDGIKIGYKKTSEANYTYIDVDKSATSKEITGLTNGTLYDFSYYTYKNDGNTPVNSISKSLNGNPTRPNAVTGFAATPVSGSKIKFSWTKNFGVYSGIKLYYKQYSDTNYSLLTTISNNTSTEYEWTLSGTNTGYLYDVYAVPYYIYETNTGAACTSIKANTSVDAVTGLSVTATTTDSISISWTNPTTAYDSLSITYTKDGVTKDGPTVEKTATSAIISGDSGLTPGCNYTINVIAKSTKNNTNYTKSVNTSQYTRPNAPTNVNLERPSNSNTSLKVTWTNPSSSYSGVYVYCGTSTTFANSTCKACITNKDNTYTITGLTAGTKYYVWVVSYSGTKISDSPAASTVNSAKTTTIQSNVSTYTRPNSVTGLKVTATSTGSATLSWTAPSGNTSGYRIYKKDNTNSGSLSLYDTITTTSITVSDLTAGHNYTFEVRAYASATSSNTNESSTATVSQTIRPGAVSGVTVKRDTTSPGSKLVVSWSYSSTGTTTGALVFYGTESTFSSIKNSVSSTSTSATITGLSNGTKYNVWVVPYAGTAPTASTVTGGTSLNTGDVPSSPAYEYTKPNSISGLKVTATSTSDATLSWTAPSSGSYSGYRIYVQDVSSGGSLTYKAYSSSASASVTGLTAGHNYKFDIRAYAAASATSGASNESGSTTVSQYIKPNAVSDITLSRNSSNPNTSLDVSWTKSSSGSTTGFMLFYGTSSTFSNSTYKTYTTSTSATISGLSANTRYYVFVVPYAGTKPDSSYVLNGTALNVGSASYTNRYTAPNAVTNLKYTHDDGMGRVKITWTNPASYSSLKVYANGTWFNISTGSTYVWIDIPSYATGDVNYLYVYAYSSDDNYNFTSVKHQNLTGNIMIDTTTYSYTGFANVSTSNRTVSQNTKDYNWSKNDNEVHHSVFYGSGSVSIPIYSMCKYEVDQELYKKVMGSNPSKKVVNSYYPVDYVPWNDAILFCNKLSAIFDLTPVYCAKLTSTSSSYIVDWTVGSNPYAIAYWTASSNGFRLPTKAEWEFAARGGDPSNSTHWKSYYSGSQDTSKDSSYRKRVAVDNSMKSPERVDYQRNTSYLNRLGIYNMSGNVWEWIYEYDGSEILGMGGSWDNDTRCGVDSSYQDSRSKVANHLGFRLCRYKVTN